MQRSELEQYMNGILEPELYKDLCPNGLQVEGSTTVKKIITGVSACVELFNAALEHNADTILVHHGIIWNFERPLYKGGYKKRVELLLKNNINLFGYHLPLDGHPKYGNNAVIAELLGLKNRADFGYFNGKAIGFSGEIEETSAQNIFTKIAEKINPDSQFFPFGPDKIKKIGIISGGAQKEIKQAVMQGLDLFITGEASEHIYHYAKEEGIHFVAAGHHATEVFGVQAFGAHLKEKFSLDVEFINIPNPI